MVIITGVVAAIIIASVVVTSPIFIAAIVVTSAVFVASVSGSGGLAAYPTMGGRDDRKKKQRLPHRDTPRWWR